MKLQSTPKIGLGFGANGSINVELELGEAVSTYVYNRQEWDAKYWMTPLYKNISNEGIVI